jgi:localization factor PodJL
MRGAGAGAWRTGLLILAAAAACWMGMPQALAQGAALKYEVKGGDTLFAIVRKTLHPGVSRNQMIAALYRANTDLFPGGNINVLAVGMVLEVPARDVVAAIAPAEADRQVRELLAKPAAAPLPTVKLSPPPEPSPPKPAPAKPKAAAVDDPARLYRDGLARESRGDDKGALRAFLAAGEAGYGPAQRRLGEIYDKGNTATPRDYETALKWYQKAREQGVEIPKPIVRTPR